MRVKQHVFEPSKNEIEQPQQEFFAAEALSSNWILAKVSLIEYTSTGVCATTEADATSFSSRKLISPKI